jgi:GDP-L-fucose synthase
VTLTDKRILVTGGAGFFGRHIVDRLYTIGCKDIFVPRAEEYDLRRIDNINNMLNVSRPDIIIHAAAHCGGIGLNKSKPAELFYDNAIMGIQLMHQACMTGVKKFVQIGTVCEYPKVTKSPFKEEDLWKGYPEETNAPYGIAKKALLVQGQAYRQQYGFNVIHLLPVNLYGPGDNFNPQSSHVMPALIKKFVDAKRDGLNEVQIWGTGKASREFLYVKDAAEAVVLATAYYDRDEPVNIGTGDTITIAALAKRIAEEVNYKGKIVFNAMYPDGQLERRLSTRMAFENFGFTAKTYLSEGLKETLVWYYAQELGYAP